MRARRLWVAAVCAGLCLVLLVSFTLTPSSSARAAEDSPVERGTLNGAAYEIQMPTSWNGTLLLYSHGYASPGSTPRQIDAPSATVADWLVQHGYALAGSAYARQGWAVQDGLTAQMALVDYFEAHHTGLHRTVAWGSSMGGLITETLAERNAKRFQGALAMCAPLAGAVGEWNARLDSAFAFKYLLAPDSALAVTGIAHPADNVALARTLLDRAQAQPAGRARIALASALGQLPGWMPGALSPEAGPHAMELAQYRQWHGFGTSFLFAQRSYLEGRAGGNPSWNTGVDYGALLAASGQEADVKALYAQAGQSLDQDLARLAAAPRISADGAATSYLARYAAPTGTIGVPLLSMHTVGDTLVPATEERAFAQTVGEARRGQLLQQVFVGRGGHCAFTPSEQIVALQVLEQRLDRGSWPAAGIETELQQRGSTLGLGDARFVAAQPSPFSRPFVPSGRGRDGTRN